MSGSTGRTDPHDEDAIDPDGDPELRNPRDERDVDHEDTTDPDTDPDIVNPRDTRTD
jgi:hypothetical protein